MDGNHTYDYTRCDFENVVRHLVPGGFILMGDTWDGSDFGSARLMAEIKKNKTFRMVAKKPNHLIQKLV